MKKNISYLINIVLLVILVFLFIRENYPEKIINKINSTSKPYNYEDNWQYKQELSLYNHYQSKANIVMLGNSITYRANWNELLNRTDIVNRGVGGDTTEGFLSRLDHVTNADPKLCFIMGGINDIQNGISPDSTGNNLKKITDILIRNEVKPIVFSILYVSKNYPNYKNINYQVTKVNQVIIANCIKNNIEYIDLNKSLSNEEILIEDFSFDGLHLTGLGYNKWKEIIIPVIERNMSYLD